MKPKYFYVSSILFFCLAFASHLGARQQFVEAQHLRAESLSSSKRGTEYVANPANRLSKRGRLINKIGYVFTVCGVACLTSAMIRRERGLYYIPIGLLALDMCMVMLL